MSALLLSNQLMLKECGLHAVDLTLLLESFAVALLGLGKLCSSESILISLSLLSRWLEGVCSGFIIATLIFMASSYYTNLSSYISATILGVQMA